MANPLLDLRRLLLKSALQTSGTIIEVLRDSSYRVRTVSGSVSASATGNAAFQLGDEVLVANGIIVGRVNPARSIPVYEV